MEEGRNRLEESALVVQEVAKELKLKDERSQEIAAKLVQTLFALDGKIDEKEATSRELVSLSDVS